MLLVSGHIEDLKVMGIEKIDHNNSRKQRKLRERYWIFKLRTLMPEGLNIEDYQTPRLDANIIGSVLAD